MKWKFLTSTVEDRIHDLYGDGRIRLVLSPGHAVGLMSVLARLDEQLVLLTGDAADTAAHYRNETLAFYLDLPALCQSLKNLHRLEEEEGVNLVIFAHDGDQVATLEKGAMAHV